MEEQEVSKFERLLKEDKIKCGVYKADKITLCGAKVEDLVALGTNEVFALCLEHSEGLEQGKAYLMKALNGEDCAIQLKIPVPDAIIEDVSVSEPTPPS